MSCDTNEFQEELAALIKKYVNSGKVCTGCAYNIFKQSTQLFAIRQIDEMLSTIEAIVEKQGTNPPAEH